MRRSRTKRLARWSIIFGALAGTGLVYFGDPDNGLERRQRAWGLLLGWLTLGNRPVMQPTGAEPRARVIQRPAPVDDAELAERVRHEIFRDPVLRAEGVQVSADQGVVTLRGDILDAARLLALVAEVRDVPGVIEVQNLLHSPAKPEVAKAPPGDLPDVTVDAQAVPVTPADAALTGVDALIGVVEEAPQPMATRTRSSRASRARTAPKPAEASAAPVTPKKPSAKSSAKRAARQTTAARASGTKRGKAMQPDSYDQEPITTQKPTQDENVDFQILETPQMKDAVEGKNPQQAQSGSQSSGQKSQSSGQSNQSGDQSDQGSQAMNQDQSQQNMQAGSSQSATGNDSGLPGGGVGRREDPGHTGVYPMSASDGASGDAPVQNENAFGQGDQGAAGYQDSGGSAIYDIPGASTGEEDQSQTS